MPRTLHMQVTKLGRNKYQYFSNLRDGGYLHQKPDTHGKGCYAVSDKGKEAAEEHGWI